MAQHTSQEPFAEKKKENERRAPSPPADLIDSPEVVLFDYPDTDVILHSRGSQMFCVLKIYIINSSSALGELIQAASDIPGAARSASAPIRLPQVQLSESSAILSSLLTFIFPVTPVLPSTLEETMELLSVAQKYEMTSVLIHNRGSLSRRHPLFISPENSLFTYALA